MMFQDPHATSEKPVQSQGVEKSSRKKPLSSCYHEALLKIERPDENSDCVFGLIPTMLYYHDTIATMFDRIQSLKQIYYTGISLRLECRQR